MRIKVKIGGMTCAACSSSVERALQNTDGVQRATVNLATNTATVDYDPEKTDISGIYDAIEFTGFDVISENDSEKEERSERVMRIRLAVAASFTVVLLYVAMGHMVGLPLPDLFDDAKFMSVVQLILCLPVIIAGSGFYVRGIPNLVRLRPNMDTLIALGTSAALIFSVYSMVNIFNSTGDAHSLYFESAATIITLVMVGKYLESRSKYKTGEAVRKLIALSPDEANVIRDGREIRIGTNEVVVGDTVIVRPGEKVPVDGTVIEGNTSVDESMLTGESTFADKSPGDGMFAGTMNINGSVQMTADLVGKDTMLSHIVQIMEDAQSSKAPVARLADRVAGVFVPVVMAIAVISCLIWVAAGKSVEFALTVLVSVLVIACPCALGLATPLAIIVGTGKGAEHGILFKTAESLETVGKVDTVILDKTGTITKGRPEVTDIISDDKDRLIYIAASAESSSEHPLGKAIVDHAERNGITYTRPSDFTAHVGNGIECVVDGTRVHIGNMAFMDRIGVDIGPFKEDIAMMSSQGKTVMIVSENMTVTGSIAVADVVRETSADAVRSFNSLDIDVYMVTGDSRNTANAIASMVGIGNIMAETMPGDKSKIVEDLQSNGKIVAMVGDGINDAPALIRSDIGVAMGSGTDIAVDSADVVLVNSDLRNVPAAVEIGRATLRNVKQNLFFAFCYNIIGIPVAAGLLYVFGGPLLDPMIAALAMSLSSVSVVLNALRLRNHRPESLYSPNTVRSA